ncbi:MAG: thioredoxin family protein [Patescibacteria group bacterium]
MPKLLEFYGEECPHCKKMDSLVERLEKEIGVKVEKYEIWHNEQNAKMMEQYDKGYCGGVPFFYNVDVNRWICGDVDYEELKNWAVATSNS